MEEIVVKNKRFTLLEVKASHPDHVTYLATYNGVKYLIRTFSEGYEQALADYKTLKRAGINISRLCYHDDENKVMVLDHFPEEDVLKQLSKGDLPDIYFDALFKLYKFARFSKAGLDWHPQNFMLRGTEMFYLPIKITELKEGNRLEDGGILWWFRGKEGLELLKSKGYNVDGIEPLQPGEINKKVVLMSIKNW